MIKTVTLSDGYSIQPRVGEHWTSFYLLKALQAYKPWETNHQSIKIIYNSPNIFAI